MEQVYLAFLTGLTTGGLSCMAVQGGLLATSIAQNSSDPTTSKSRIIGSFVIAKLIAYTLLGALLGALGSAITLSVKTQGILQIFVGLFMLATAARLLDLHPIFRKLVIQPPSWAYKLLKKEAKNSSLFAPTLMGAFTILMPCGITQAMMVVAIGSGNPVMGALIMLAFTLGTSPLFFALGATTLQFLTHRKFAFVASLTIAFFALLSINGGIGLTGSPYTFSNYLKVAFSQSPNLPREPGQVAGVNSEGQQEATITVRSNGYSTQTSTLKSGVPVRLTLKTQNVSGCARAFTIPSLNISRVLPVSGTETIQFTPTQPGLLAFSCSMGMYTGSFTII